MEQNITEAVVQGPMVGKFLFSNTAHTGMVLIKNNNIRWICNCHSFLSVKPNYCECS